MPAPEFDPDAPLQALVCNLDASPYVGRLAICRVYHGTLRKGDTVAWCRLDGTVERTKVTELYVTDALDRVPTDEAGPGEIAAVAGMAEITIGETLADADHPVALPAITVDEPSLTMTIGINTSPLAGTDGTKLTARQVKSRLDAELIGNVSLRVEPTERPDTWEVQGRGELQLAVLVETMRREGFELTVGKPQVVTREIDGTLHEPMERVAVDVPDDYLGVVTQLLALRKGSMVEMVNHGTGWVRLDYRVPARGLVGFRTEFLTETRGTGMLHHVFDGWEPWAGELRTRRNGSMVADRRGVTTTHALMNLQDRGTLLVGPAVEVYEGMVIGENARADEMDVNPTKEKKLTNVRSSTADGARAAHPAAHPLARAGTRVHRGRRVRRGDPGGRPAAQGDPRRGHPVGASGAGPATPEPSSGLALVERRAGARLAGTRRGSIASGDRPGGTVPGRDGRADKCAALEKPWGVGSRGFESHSLRPGDVSRHPRLGLKESSQGARRASGGLVRSEHWRTPDSHLLRRLVARIPKGASSAARHLPPRTGVLRPVAPSPCPRPYWGRRPRRRGPVLRPSRLTPFATITASCCTPL